MICEHCYGKGERGSVEWDGVRVCPECQGSGIVSCCDTAGAQSVIAYALAEQGHDPYLKASGNNACTCAERMRGIQPGGFVEMPCPSCAARGRTFHDWVRNPVALGCPQVQYLKPEDYWAEVDSELKTDVVNP